jgi:hypothetical protein
MDEPTISCLPINYKITYILTYNNSSKTQYPLSHPKKGL